MEEHKEARQSGPKQAQHQLKPKIGSDFSLLPKPNMRRWPFGAFLTAKPNIFGDYAERLIILENCF